MEHIGEGKNEQERLRERKLYLGEILRVLRVGGVRVFLFRMELFLLIFGMEQQDFLDGNLVALFIYLIELLCHLSRN
jgi:hypothetical protein